MLRQGGARILALRLDAFARHAFASNQAVQSTTSTSDTDVLMLTHAPATAAHAIIAIESFNTASTTASGYLNFTRDGTNQTEFVREGVNTAAYLHAGVVQRRHSPPRRRHGSGAPAPETAGATVAVANLAIAVLQLEAMPVMTRRRYMEVAG